MGLSFISGIFGLYRQRIEGEHSAVTRYERDRYGRVLKLTNPNGNVVSYMYEHGFKEPTMTTLPEGETFRYDAAGRALLSYTYDPNGNRTGLADPTGKRTEYTYDYADRLMEVRDNGKRQARYTYNPDGTISTLEIGDCGGEGVLYTEYSYDMDKNLTSLKTLIRQGAMGGAYGRLTDNRYSYDMAGKCIMKQTPAGETRYRYDSLYRLTEAVYPQGRREQFTYDRAGNRLTRTT